MLEVTLFYVLMAAPSATDDHVMNHAVPLGVYTEVEECSDAKMLLDEQRLTLPRHLFCMPVGITKGKDL